MGLFIAGYYTLCLLGIAALAVTIYNAVKG